MERWDLIIFVFVDVLTLSTDGYSDTRDFTRSSPTAEELWFTLLSQQVFGLTIISENLKPEAENSDLQILQGPVTYKGKKYYVDNPFSPSACPR